MQSVHFNTHDMKNTVDRDGCIMYSSSIICLQVDGTVIHMPALTELAWLQQLPNGHPGPQKLTFVFEAGDQPVNPIIRLHKTQVDEYFRNALEVTLDPTDNDKQASLQSIQRALGDYTKRTASTPAILPSVPCYGVHEADAVKPEGQNSILQDAALVQPLPCGEVDTVLPSLPNVSSKDSNAYGSLSSAD